MAEYGPKIIPLEPEKEMPDTIIQLPIEPETPNVQQMLVRDAERLQLILKKLGGIEPDVIDTP